jgi:hypothetical protein
MKIEKALQAPIIIFFRKLVPGCITGTLLSNKNQCSGFTKFASPQKKPKHSLRAESAWQPFFEPRKGFCLLKDGKRYYNQWKGLFEDNFKVERSIEIETAFIVASKESASF